MKRFEQFIVSRQMRLDRDADGFAWTPAERASTHSERYAGEWGSVGDGRTSVLPRLRTYRRTARRRRSTRLD